MKTFLPFVLLLVATSSYSQLSFTNPTLKTAKSTDLKKGAVYLFKDVTSGVNAEVTITDLVNGATVSKIDDNSGGLGYAAAFQPEIKTGDKGEAYALFSVKFIDKILGTPYLLKTLQATALDIDGTKDLKEFDELNLNGGSASFMGGTLQLTLQSLPIIGNLFNKSFRADNKTGVDNNGIDTAAKGNMFTVTNSALNSFTVKLGAKTTKKIDDARQYSIYMMGFQYPNVVMLPVKLLSFTAAAKNNVNAIQWTTTHEENVASYIIERSEDAANFKAIGTMMPKGNMTTTTSYSFNDATAMAPVSYYRLRCVDASGKFSFSAIQTIKTNNNSISASAFPNPFSNTLTITYPSAFQGKQAKVEIYNSNGQLITAKSGKANSTETLETSSLQRGIYIIRVSTATESNQLKVVKN